jgi:hypothetical protein
MTFYCYFPSISFIDGRVKKCKVIANKSPTKMDSTSTKEPLVQTTIVNFLRTNDKDIDWRYRKYFEISHGENDEGERNAIIHWIGIATLNPQILLAKEGEQIAIKLAFADKKIGKFKLVVDKKARRDDDGASLGEHDAVFYHIPPEIVAEFKTATKQGFKYFHLFLEEKVDYRGTHSVSLLHKPNSTEDYKYGVPEENPWFKEPFEKYGHLLDKKISDELIRICLLGNDSYNWMK